MGFHESEAPLLGPKLLQARINMSRDNGLRFSSGSLPYSHVPHLEFSLSDLPSLTPIRIELPSAHLERTNPERFNIDFIRAISSLNRVLENEE